MRCHRRRWARPRQSVPASRQAPQELQLDDRPTARRRSRISPHALWPRLPRAIYHPQTRSRSSSCIAVAVCGQNTSPCSRAWMAMVRRMVASSTLCACSSWRSSGFVREGPAQPLEVAGGADVHGVGDGGDGIAWLVIGAVKIIGQGGVGVAGEADFADRQAHFAGPQAGHGVAEVAGGDDEVEWCAVLAPPAERGMRVVGHLRQQPAETDAVGG